MKRAPVTAVLMGCALVTPRPNSYGNDYRCGSRSKAGSPSGTWWNGCLSMV
jgi:hypothetical protein